MIGWRENEEESTVVRDYRKKMKRVVYVLPVWAVILFATAIACEVIGDTWPIFVAFPLMFFAGATIIGTHGGEVFHDD